MNHPVITKSIEITASPANVWRVFSDPKVTMQMGGEYVTDWMVGSSFGWKGHDGAIYTKGKILQLEPERTLKHDLVDLHNNLLLSVITYDFRHTEKGTTLIAREELNYAPTEDQLRDVSEGWDFALASVKDIAEKL